ncbi:DEAD/DEAH box helicase [Nocardioides yefusunii]|uniref:DEAD/DEAH box helicase n=1 Tax=Nocardioides yefusunii TaxID=2500546 RepID=A0ABW1QYH7_9ACTN|nr:DEAD/DEAH box helicase [Nocardioides yefusunii]
MSFVPVSGPATLSSAEHPAPPRDATVEFTGEGRRSVSLPIAAALPLLSRAHKAGLAGDDVHPTVVLLAGAAHLALRLVADGRFAPHEDELFWEPVLDAAAEDRIVQLAKAREKDGVDVAAAEGVVRRMVAAVVDATPRRAPQSTRRSRESGPAAAARAALRGAPAVDPASGKSWAERKAEVKARTSAEYAHVLNDRLTRLRRTRGVDDRPHLVRLSLRIDAPEEQLYAGELTLVPQVHAQDNDLHVADAALLWTETGIDASHGFGDRARTHAALAIRQAADAWEPLGRLLEVRVPDGIVLDSDEVTSLLEHGLEALAGIGVDVHWPRSIGRALSTSAVVDRAPEKRTQADGSAAREAAHVVEGALQTSTLRAQDLFAFTWQVSLAGEALTEDEMDELARATTPMIRLRDNWVVVDPTVAKRARRRLIRTATAPEAVAAALTGVAPLAVTGFAAQDEIAHVTVHAGASVSRLRDLIRNAATSEPVPVPAGLAATLREYQHQGMRWLATMTDLGLGACLADDMGLGKTITVIALHLHRRETAGTPATPRPVGPTLVVCPASLMGNWEAEINRFAPGIPVRRFHGSSRILDGVGDGFVLTTYGTLRSDLESEQPRLTGVAWDLVVADEAQHVKNSRSATARALRKVESRARVALTGTPVENNLTELWSLLDWCVPGLLGSRLAFRRVWAAPIEAGVDSHVTRAFADLIGPFLLRRRKSDPGIAPELPPKTETDHLLGLTTEQAVLYETFVKDRMDRIERSDAQERRGLVLAMLTGLKQICNHPAQFLKQTNPRIGGRSEKFDLLDELIGTVLAEDGAVLVFTQYVAMARLVEQHLTRSGIAHQFLHGGTPVPEREAMVKRFQTEDGDDRVPVFILSLKAGGTGLNLTRADHVIHLDRWWNPAVEEQATDRAYRIGQTKPVQVHRMITRGTVEERVAALLERKRDLADSVLANGEAALTELSNDDLRDLVTLG